MQIKYVTISVKDQNAALKFYTEKLGFKKMADVTNGPYRWLTVVSPDGVDGAELVLDPMNFPPAQVYQKALYDAGMPATTMITHDIQSEVKRLKSLGVVFKTEPQNMGMFSLAVFEDGVGNLINLMQPMS